MQIKPARSRYLCGSILVVTLILSILLGITLASYLYWVRTQNLLVAESQAWNYALTIAEAGIEEGMAQINVAVGTSNPLSYFNSIATLANGWTSVGSAPPVYTKTNSSIGYSVTISNDFPPTIYSSGTTTVPVIGQTIVRTVKVTTTTNSLFGVGIATIQGINMNGNNIVVDAYDSADTVHFPGGVWNATNAFAGGDVASESGVLSVGNADIHGRLLMAPGASYAIGNQGLVGDMPWNWPAQSGLESPDWVFYDWNKDFPDVIAPYNSGLNLTPGTGTNQYVLGSGNYFVNGNVSINQNSNLLVTGNATVYVTGSFTANSKSTITIASGAVLKLYVGQSSGAASSITFGVVNQATNNNAYNVQVYGLPTMTSFTLSGNNAYMGTIYAPECAVTLNGGGNNSVDYQGACVVKSFNSNGHFNLHYDKNLSRIGFPRGFTCASWIEL